MWGDAQACKPQVLPQLRKPTTCSHLTSMDIHVSMDSIAYISILQTSQVWEKHLKGFGVSEVYLVSHLHTQGLVELHTALSVFSCMCMSLPLRNLALVKNEDLFIWPLSLALAHECHMCSAHSPSGEHMHCSYDKCKMHFLCICRLCIQCMLVFLPRKSQIEMWEPSI